MKLKRFLSFFLILTMLLGVLAVDILAAYTQPTNDQIKTAMNGEENAEFLYASDFSDAQIEYASTADNHNTTLKFSSSSEKSENFLKSIEIFDQWALSGRNITAEEGSVVWRSWDSTAYGTHISDSSSTYDNNNIFQINAKNAPAGRGFVISFDFTLYARLNKAIQFRIASTQATSQINSVFYTITADGKIKLKDGKTLPLTLPLDTPQSLTAHIKVIAPDSADADGALLYDTYLNGMLIASDTALYTSQEQAKIKSSDGVQTGLSTDFAITNIRFMHLNGSAQPVDEDGNALNCGNETHTACSENCPFGKKLASLDSLRVYYSDECYETVHGTEAHSYAARKDDELTHTYTCACGKSLYKEEHDLSQEGYCSVCEAGIAGVSLSIDSDLAIRYYVNATDTFTEGKALSLKVAGTVIDTYTVSDGKYVFTYDGIGPHQVGDTVNATLYADDVAIDSKEYSAEQYCREALELYADDAKLVQLVNDLLIYAKAADTYKNGSTDIAADLTLTASDYIPAKTDDKLSITGNENGAVYAAGVRFDSLNKVYFKLSAESAPAVTLNGVAAEAVFEDGYYVVYSEAIAPVDYNKTFTLALGDTAVTYTVNTYAYYMQGDEEMDELAVALYRYGKSCREYVESKTSVAIVYNLNDGINPANAPLTYNPAVGVKLPVPTKGGYAFGGWYESADFTGERITRIEKGTEDVVTVYAKWVASFAESFEGSVIPEGTETKKLNGVSYIAAKKTGATVHTEEDQSGNTYLVWTKGTADPQVQKDGALYSFLGTETSFTFSVDLARYGEEAMFKTQLFLRVSGANKFTLFSNDAEGNVYLGDISAGLKVGEITNEFKTFTFTFDFVTGTAYAYDALGNKITDADGAVVSMKVDVPAASDAETMLDWLGTLSNYNFVWYTGTAPDGVLKVDNLTLSATDFVF